MDAQFSLARTWLVFIRLYNAAQRLNAGAHLVLGVVVQPILVTLPDEALEEADASREAMLDVMDLLTFVHVAAAVACAASVAIVVWLFRWRKAAFRACCISAALTFTLELLTGEDFWMAGLDLVGLAGWLALMIRIEPGSWGLLD